MAKQSPKVRAPIDQIKDALTSGFLQCTVCNAIWFGGPADPWCCPDGHRGVVRVAITCRTCDALVSLGEIADHLASEMHADCGHLFDSSESIDAAAQP